MTHGAEEQGVKTGEKLKREVYEKELERLQVELVKLQEWVKHAGLKVCVLFEGRDGAAKAARSRPSPSE